MYNINNKYQNILYITRIIRVKLLKTCIYKAYNIAYMGNKKETSFGKKKISLLPFIIKKISLLSFNVIFSHVCYFWFSQKLNILKDCPNIEEMWYSFNFFFLYKIEFLF